MPVKASLPGRTVVGSTSAVAVVDVLWTVVGATPGGSSRGSSKRGVSLSSFRRPRHLLASWSWSVAVVSVAVVSVAVVSVAVVSVAVVSVAVVSVAVVSVAVVSVAVVSVAVVVVVVVLFETPVEIVKTA